MNDFFTELDSDILEVKKIPNSPESRIMETRRPSSIVQMPVAPVQKKHEPREIREKGEIRERREDPVSNFSITGVSPSIFPGAKPQFLPALPKGQTRMVAIGGQNEVGKNMSMYQYGDEVILIDGGIRFPENDMPGAKYSLPDITALFPMKQKIRAIIITSGHQSHIG